jgi:hypothetical protein
MTDFNLPSGVTISKPSQVAHPELFILYGRAGGGKTYLGASASELPHVKKMLIIDTEGSASGTLTDFSDEKVDIVRVKTYKEFAETMNAVFDADDAGTLPYDVVQIDTFDVAQDMAIKHFHEKSPGDTRAAWGLVKEWSDTVARGMKNLKALGILVVHEREEKALSGGILARLRLSGSARDTLPGIADVVAYVTRELNEDGEEVTIAQFASQDGLVTKNRFRFPPAVEDPSIPALFKYIDDRKKGGKR